VNLDTPKMNALRELSGAPPAPRVSAIVDGASFEQPVTPGSFASLIGENLARLTHEWGEAIVDDRALPTMLGGFQARFNGKPAAVAYASNLQANVIVPPDLPAGPVDVEVFNQGGIWKGTVEVRSVAPAWFGHTRDGKFYIASRLARPARSSEIVELYAVGLGPTSPPMPANEVLVRVYPLADAASVRVAVGRRDADVVFAGVTMAGVYQVNLRVPDGVAGGDQPDELKVGLRIAPPAYLPVEDSRAAVR
jgi:uncharacterized protein (TIGR03437 family)